MGVVKGGSEMGKGEEGRLRSLVDDISSAGEG